MSFARVTFHPLTLSIFIRYLLMMDDLHIVYYLCQRIIALHAITSLLREAVDKSYRIVRELNP
jgi:hypothetical protein